MKIQAQVVADSTSPQNNRLTTLLITFPRFILAELNTHRMLSKNSASSRAIPTTRLLEMVEKNPFIPIAWQKEHKGMQGTDYIEDNKTIQQLEYEWIGARNFAMSQVGMLNKYSPSKQIVNRLLEPFMWHTVLISGTEWENFFELRCPQYHSPVDTHFRHRSRKDCIAAHSNTENLELMAGFTDVDWLKINEGQAEIHMMALAEAIWDAMNESKPKQLKAGEWHIPFEDKIVHTQEFAKLMIPELPKLTKDMDGFNHFCSILAKISTAMAARTSYTVVGDEKEISYDRLIDIHDRMAIAKPFHASPFEHCAKAMNHVEYETLIKGEVEYRPDAGRVYIGDNASGWCRNYRGFIQYRHILESNDKLK